MLSFFLKSSVNVIQLINTEIFKENIPQMTQRLCSHMLGLACVTLVGHPQRKEQVAMIGRQDAKPTGETKAVVA